MSFKKLTGDITRKDVEEAVSWLKFTCEDDKTPMAIRVHCTALREHLKISNHFTLAIIRKLGIEEIGRIIAEYDNSADCVCGECHIQDRVSPEAN